ncbi:biopolymer transport protein ExbB [Dysgonomonadaceae bacterium PH5-43]|nr:biopolymer transport protein ExbB [Dysgonomonadaceae bacterium PH5-43]
METKNQTVVKKKREGKKSRGVSAALVIVCCAVLAILFFKFILGNEDNFVNGDPDNHPIHGNMLGTVYKGGYNVAIVITLMLTVIALSVERFFALSKCKGKGNLINFVYDVKAELKKGDIAAAEALCAKQKGSVAAIVDAGLKKYKEMETTKATMTKEAKVQEIKTEIEEATALELPIMQQNLPIIATISTLGTLFGLLGTVTGMIKSFSAMGGEGGVDPIALSTGISEALVNTALGIATGAIAIISYAFFTGKVDNMTFAIDEMGFALTQTYAETHEA